MIGAIEFLRALRDCCKAHPKCESCPLGTCDTSCDKCGDYVDITDAEINDLIGRIMAWKRRQEASNE